MLEMKFQGISRTVRQGSIVSGTSLAELARLQYLLLPLSVATIELTCLKKAHSHEIQHTYSQRRFIRMIYFWDLPEPSYWVDYCCRCCSTFVSLSVELNPHWTQWRNLFCKLNRPADLKNIRETYYHPVWFKQTSRFANKNTYSCTSGSLPAVTIFNLFGYDSY